MGRTLDVLRAEGWDYVRPESRSPDRTVAPAARRHVATGRRRGRRPLARARAGASTRTSTPSSGTRASRWSWAGSGRGRWRRRTSCSTRSCTGSGTTSCPPLRWIADAHVVITSSGSELDWDRLLRLSTRYRLAAYTSAALAYLDRLFPTIVPPPVLAAARALPVTRQERREFERSTRSSPLALRTSGTDTGGASRTAARWAPPSVSSTSCACSTTSTMCGSCPGVPSVGCTDGGATIGTGRVMRERTDAAGEPTPGVLGRRPVQHGRSAGAAHRRAHRGVARDPAPAGAAARRARAHAARPHQRGHPCPGLGIRCRRPGAPVDRVGSRRLAHQRRARRAVDLRQFHTLRMARQPALGGDPDPREPPSVLASSRTASSRTR